MVKFQIDKILNELYFNPKYAGSFSGVSAFYKLIKEKKLAFIRKEIKNWLVKQESYSIHKSIKKNFKRNRVIAFGIDDTWQADLVDVKNIAK